MSLIAQYTFKNNCNDVSGNGYNGTPSNVTYVDKPDNLYFSGKVGNFNGSSGHINLPNIDAIAYNKQFNLSFWFNTRNKNAQKNIFSCGNGAAAASTLGLETGFSNATNNPPAIAGLCFNGNGASYLKPIYNNNINEWYHFSMNWKGNGVAPDYYINGAKIASTVLPDVFFTGTNMAIGYDRYNVAYPQFHMDGMLGDFRIYDSNLTAAEVEKIYQQGITSPKGNAAPLMWLLP